MYVPHHFEETDTRVLHALIDAHPLGAWVTLAGGELLVNHIPFFLEPVGNNAAGHLGTLAGHVARANPLWLRVLVGIEIPVTALAGQWKVCQNRDAAAREGAAAGLCAGAAASHAPLAAALAAEMATAVRRGG